MTTLILTRLSATWIEALWSAGARVNWATGQDRIDATVSRVNEPGRTLCLAMQMMF